MESSNHLADAGPDQVVIYADVRGSATTVEQQRFSRDAQTDVDKVLAANGWRRVGQWARSDDMPPGHRVCAVQPSGYPDGHRYGHADTVDPVDQLDRDQRAGRARRINNTPLGLLLVLLVLLAGCGTTDAAGITHPGAQSSGGPLPIAAEDGAGYDRDAFGDYDRDALLQRSLERHGCYYSAADDTCHASEDDVHGDHLVALAEAWASGLDPGQRDAIATDVDNLWLMTAALNMSKSDQDPAEWLPPSTAAVCAYVARWVQVKTEYHLSADRAEANAIAEVRADCP